MSRVHERDHPRVCGEHYSWPYGVDLSEGSSPRMRGALIPAERMCRIIGIIPAYAGSTSNHAVLNRFNKDHPRVCGEHSLCLCLIG